MKIIFAGGGGANDSLPLDQAFVNWIGSGGKILYLPIALRGIRTFESCLEWISFTFASLGITDITMWTSLDDHKGSDLLNFNGVYIGGGNTFSLLDELQQSGFDQHLKIFAESGRPIYGGSAGAAVLGRDIQTVSRMDKNNVGLIKTTGLDLAQGHAIWPHYTTADDELIHSYIKQYKFPVLAISERSGVILDNIRLRGTGLEPAFRFDGNGKTVLN